MGDDDDDTWAIVIGIILGVGLILFGLFLLFGSLWYPGWLGFWTPHDEHHATRHADLYAESRARDSRRSALFSSSRA